MNRATGLGRGRRSWGLILVAVAATIFVLDWIRVVAGHSSDFRLHWEFGRRFLAGEFLYKGGLHIPYPPFWAVASAPLSLLPMDVSRALLYPRALVAIAALLFVLDRLTRKSLALASDGPFWAAAAALALSCRFVERDLIECGLNLALVALTWLGIYLWTLRRELAGGLCLGLAVALKCTPLLFVAYFALKRQWRMVAVASLSAAAFTLVPVCRQGPRSYAQHMSVWATNVARGVSQKDPSIGVLGEEVVQNLSLRPALARFLMRYPETHLSRIRNAWYVDLLDLSPTAAGLVARVAVLTLLLWVAVLLRSPLAGRDDPTLPWDCAALSVVMLLLSPITWEQHCVAVLPAFYLIGRRVLQGHRLSRLSWAAISGWVFWVLVLNYDLVGRDFARLLHSYHVITWNLVALLLVTLACRGEVQAEKASLSTSLPRRPAGVESPEVSLEPVAP
jgi:hypothetical protein